LVQGELLFEIGEMNDALFFGPVFAFQRLQRCKRDGGNDWMIADVVAIQEP
jgi:hypothetical protein